MRRVSCPTCGVKVEEVPWDCGKHQIQVIRERCGNALNILDRFHIAAKMNDALNDVRSAGSRKLVQEGLEPVLTGCQDAAQSPRTDPQQFPGKKAILQWCRKSYGFRTFRITKLALYQVLASCLNPNSPTLSTDQAFCKWGFGRDWPAMRISTASPGNGPPARWHRLNRIIVHSQA